jgi:DNA repair protein RecO (recombination protein O)
MRPFSSECIILRRTNYGEADRIINFITPARGKMSAIAKGVRRPKSKLAGGLELFAVCDVTFVEGRSELAVVTSARLKQFFGNILKDYDRMQCAYECVKQINRVTETVSEPEFYNLLSNSLAALDDLAINWQLTELCFKLQLQSLLGHSLNLATAKDSSKLEAGKNYDYDFSEDAFYEQQHGRFGTEHIKLLRLATHKNALILKQVSGLEQVLSDCLWLVRATQN